MLAHLVCLIIWALFTIEAGTRHLEPSGPFPPPALLGGESSLKAVFRDLDSKTQSAARCSSSPWIGNITSFSIAVTSGSKDLWTTSYTAPILGNYTDSPPNSVTDHTYFRIASISKVFTVLAVLIQQRKGKWSLEDSITKYVPELRGGTSGNTIDWESITLETLASQLSGIPRECPNARRETISPSLTLNETVKAT